MEECKIKPQFYLTAYALSLVGKIKRLEVARAGRDGRSCCARTLLLVA